MIIIDIYIFPKSYFPLSLAYVDLYCTCHNKLIIRYKSVHKFDQFNHAALRAGLTKDTTDTDIYFESTF